MKKNLLLLILFPLVILSQSGKHKVQLIEDLDSRYKPILLNDVIALSTFSEENLEIILGVFNKTFSKYWTEISKIDGILTIKYIFYINELGKIDRVQRIDIAYSPTPPKIFFSTIELKLLELFALAKLNPIKGNNFGKYRFTFEYHVGKDKYNKMSSSFSIATENKGFLSDDRNDVPRLLELPTPKISEADKKLNPNGKVFIKVTVDESGKATKAVIIEGAGKVLDKAAIEAIMLARFRPGIKNGKAYQMDVIIPIEFDMEK